MVVVSLNVKRKPPGLSNSVAKLFTEENIWATSLIFVAYTKIIWHEKWVTASHGRGNYYRFHTNSLILVSKVFTHPLLPFLSKEILII